MCRRNIRPSRLPCAPRSVAFPSPVSALKCPAAPGRFSGQTHTSDQSETVSPGCGPCMKTASDPYPNVCLRCHSVSHRRQIHSRQLTPLLLRCATLRGTRMRNQLIDPVTYSLTRKYLLKMRRSYSLQTKHAGVLPTPRSLNLQ